MNGDLLQINDSSKIITQSVSVIPNPVLVSDVTANDSDKILTVPSSHIYSILSIYVVLTTTATVGNRQFEIEIGDGGSTVIFANISKDVQIASTTERYTLRPGPYPVAEVPATQHFICLPWPCHLAPSWTIRLLDNAAIDAAADDMTIQMLVDDFNLAQT